MAILYQTLIWLRWPWNTGLRCAPLMVILPGFAGCVGLIPSRPKHEECRHLILVHNEPPRCEDRRLIDVSSASSRSRRAFRALKQVDQALSRFEPLRMKSFHAAEKNSPAGRSRSKRARSNTCYVSSIMLLG